MASDPRTALYDIVTACEAIREYCAGRSFEDYEHERKLRSACERELEIIGEAMIRLRDRHPNLFDRIPEAPRIIGFRNRLIHRYDAVDAEIVWDIIQSKMPALEQAARQLLQDTE